MCTSAAPAWRTMETIFSDVVPRTMESSTRITRAVLLDRPLSIDRGEVTDKGSINQRAVLSNRAELVASLYDKAPGAHVLTSD